MTINRLSVTSTPRNYWKEICHGITCDHPLSGSGFRSDSEAGASWLLLLSKKLPWKDCKGKWKHILARG
ncbi:hypothetical protein L6164_019374 [Bauhinia variegata]|uniref:Uncharacterized protein n=1 Tax=Bauhinia variegata TaxID=167791 RepID=A0ACB9MRH9_BAUVA|nr:hypothetical protein L6164_019374 [Bauhinia variegata]